MTVATSVLFAIGYLWVAEGVVASPAPSPASVALAKPTGVTVNDFFFHKSKVTIKHGGTVKWTWVGMTTHNVTFRSLHKHSRDQVTGTYSLRFAKPGVYHYLCTIHGFTGTVVVRK